VSPPALYDALGRPVSLGKSLGRGGEGEVFAVPASPGNVAKVYHKLPDPKRAEKIAAMAAHAAQDLLRVAAWPTATLHARPNGQIAGLIMPLVERHRELHVLYSPAQRRQVFPQADWSFLVHVAINVARAFATVHAAGHVMGDVNQKNVVVADDGTVRLIDCDSFQINANGKRFLCEVGVPDFTPPELHGQSFSGVIRTQNHDRFGLAVLLFHLLFMGRHPFVGIFRSGQADMPMDRSIREGRYAYGRAAAQLQMAPPPHSVAPAAGATPRVALLFEQAFVPAGGAERPSAAAWVEALQEMQKGLRRCSAHRGHVYASALCPWCAIEKAGGPDFFITLLGSGVAAGPVWSLDALLRQADQIQAPAGPLSTAVLAPARHPGTKRVPTRRRGMEALGIALYAAAAVCFLAMFELGGFLFLMMLGFGVAAHQVRERARDRKLETALRDALKRAADAHGAKTADYARDVNETAARFNAAVDSLKKKAQAYRGLAGEHQRAKQELTSNQRHHQLKHHLEKSYIQRARIDGVGPHLKGMLLAFGIETAADVHRHTIARVPGFGPARTAALLAWRQAIEARFVFNPNRAVDPADLAEIDRKFAATRRKLETEMEALVGEMRSLSTRSHSAMQRLLPEVRKTAEALSLAKARAGEA
jgi:DNA-binding helix-hairpin-helix protein with protein kinase domain